MANVIFNAFKMFIGNGSVDWDTDTINVSLHTNSFVPSADNDDHFDDVDNEVSGTGYTAGGQALAGKSVTQDNTNDRAVYDSNDPSWSTATITNARYAVLRKARGGAASADELIGAWDFGADISSTAATFSIAVNANGWFTVS